MWIDAGVHPAYALHQEETSGQPPPTQDVALTLLALIFDGFVFFAVTFYLPDFFQVAKGTSSLVLGGAMIPYAVLGSISSIVCSVMVIRVRPYRAVLGGGLALVIVGQGSMRTLDDQSC